MDPGERLALASLLLGLIGGVGPWLHGALARVLPFYRNPVDLTWAGFASWSAFSVAALAGFVSGLIAHRRIGRRGLGPRWPGSAAD